MTWFFAAIVMAVLAVVAVVALGRGGSLEETFDDRPDARVPEGPLTAGDIRRVRFTTAFRGYRMSEVDALLDRLASQVDSSDQKADRAREAGSPARQKGARPTEGR